jgi:hypothetical protein
MGAAYAVGLVLIYLLVVAQFRSYVVPLVIMAPIPLTIIGVMPGHALLGAQFTATSMIGMIALAGIIVRNSILLVDFINHGGARRGAGRRGGRSCAVRAQPIALTAPGRDDRRLLHPRRPDLQRPGRQPDLRHPGLDVLTLVVIPVLYFALSRCCWASKAARCSSASGSSPSPPSSASTCSSPASPTSARPASC